jgi:hypothetical protein
MNVNEGSSITQYSGPIRGSKSYFFECLFQLQINIPQPVFFQNSANIDFTSIIKDTSRYTDRPLLFTISISDYILKHDTSFTDPADRELLAINSPEITQGETRYLTLIPNDQGIGLFGSNAIVLEKLPPRATFTLGFVDPLNPSDTTLYNPNVQRDFTGGGNTLTFPSQGLEYAVIRFRVQAQFL